jgi:Methyltransferase domain
MKSTVEQIRQRFDNDVERFSNLETGQSATIDAPLVLDLITAVAAATNPDAKHVLDIGCGAGNYTLKLLQRLSNLDVTLIDLSKPMLSSPCPIGSTTSSWPPPYSITCVKMPNGKRCSASAARRSNPAARCGFLISSRTIIP